MKGADLLPIQTGISAWVNFHIHIINKGQLWIFQNLILNPSQSLVLVLLVFYFKI